jgi:two-component system cell cycle sensor histidine kinase/response regulator CckA
MAKNKSAEEMDRTIEVLEARLQALAEENAALKQANAELQNRLNQEKNFQKRLALSEDKYREIIESIQEGYFETDLTGRLTFCNQALLKIVGYTREDLIGSTFRQFTPPHTARTMRIVFGRVFKSGQDAESTQYEIFHKAGHTLTIEFAAALVRDQQGEPMGFRGVLRDVSEQVKAAEKERRLQDQLQQAQKMEALGTLAGGLAHGFNNVLMAIQGNLSLISMNLEPDHPMQKHLGRINHSTEKGSRLAREILSFAKVGKFVVMETDLNKILKSTSRMFLRSNPRLKVSELYQEDLWPTRVDRVQIGQVLLGLFMHAAEAMPNGGDLYLQSENVYLDESYTIPFGNPPGRYVKISVTDSGMGMNDEAKRRIFEPFFSPYRPLRYEVLGLAAAYGIIKSHGGLVNVYSERGHGSTFNIYLPVSRMESPAKEIKLKAGRGTETILIVDDDQTASRVGRDILERWGYRVMTAKSGTEAIDIYTEYNEDIHMVVLDVILPDLSGEQVYRELKKIDPDVRVLLASGYSINTQIKSLLNQGCADFVAKPFQTQSLSDKVRAVLDGKHVQ